MEKLKKILKSIWKVLKYIIATIFFGFAAFFLFDKSKKNEKEKAENNKEKIKNELEEKSASDIAADSPNPDTISTNIQREQEQFRERIKNRLEKKL